MDKIATLAWLDFLRLLRDRTQFGVMLVLPLMLTFLFGTMMGGGERKVAVAVSDPDGTSYSKEVVAGLPERSYALRLVSEEVARQMASSGEVAAAVIVPQGFGDAVVEGVDTKVAVVKDPRSTAALAIVQAIQGRVRRIAANAQTVRIVRAAYRDAERSTGAPVIGAASADIYAYADRLWSPDPPLAVREEAVQASRVRGGGTVASGFQQYSMGFTLMFMLFMGMGTAGGFLEDREEGTLARLLMTPTSKPLLIAGKVVGVYATVLFEAAIMVGFGAFVFGVPWGDDPLGVILLIATFGLSATGLGVMVSTLVRTRGQMSAAMAAGATALCMLGGAYWPLDIVNPTMRLIANLTPVGWAMQGLTDIVVRSQGTAQALLPSLVLAGMAALFLVVGVSRLKLE
jgi:ABC-2 type transport system permease protein